MTLSSQKKGAYRNGISGRLCFIVVILFMCASYNKDAKATEPFKPAIDLSQSEIVHLRSLAALAGHDRDVVNGQVGQSWREAHQVILGPPTREDLEQRIIEFHNPPEGKHRSVKYLFEGATGNPPGEKHVFGGVLKKIGYPALIVNFHGSLACEDWATNFDCASESAERTGLEGQIHRGFARAAESCREEIYEKIAHALRNSAERLESQEVYFVGHSQGGAFATLAAAAFVQDCRAKGSLLLRQNQVKVVTFSAPRVGDRVFVDHLHRTLGRHNIVNISCRVDIVPHVPSTGLSGVVGPVRECVKAEQAGIQIETGCTETVTDCATAGGDWRSAAIHGVSLGHTLSRSDRATIAACESFRRSVVVEGEDPETAGRFSLMRAIFDTTRKGTLGWWLFS